MDIFSPSVLTAISKLFATNPGVVVIPGGGGISMCSLAIPLLVPGQLVMISGQMHPTIGATTTNMSANISKSAGTATIDFQDQIRIASQSANVAAPLIVWHASLFNIGRVTVAGSYTFNLQGVSVGGDSTEVANVSELTATIFLR